MTDLNSGNPNQLCGLQIIGKSAEQTGNINNYFRRRKKKASTLENFFKIMKPH